MNPNQSSLQILRRFFPQSNRESVRLILQHPSDRIRQETQESAQRSEQRCGEEEGNDGGTDVGSESGFLGEGGERERVESEGGEEGRVGEEEGED